MWEISSVALHCWGNVKKHTAYLHQHGSGFVFKNSTSQKGNSLLWASNLATLRTSPAGIPASFAFFAALLVQDISALSRIWLTLQCSALMAGFMASISHPLPLLQGSLQLQFLISSKSSSSLVHFPLQRASQTFSTWTATHHHLSFRH